MNRYHVYTYGKSLISTIWYVDAEGVNTTVNLEGENDGWTFMPTVEHFAN